jgi:hypothetical protein
MKAGTQVRLKVDGTWTGKTPEAISKKTTCTTIAANDAAPTINVLSFTENEMLYWDDYGTGDPNNKTNTDNGLKVLGVAVDGVAEAPEVKDTEWERLPWSVITSGENVLNGDIIVSNNLSEDPYKFVKPTKDHVRNMIFVHPLSKITINLKAGEGFTNGTIGNTTHKFEKDPVVTLTNATTLDGIKNPAIKMPSILPYEKNVFHTFPIFTEKRDELQTYLKENEIGTIIHYPIPPHKQVAYKEWNNLSFPVTEKIHETELSLPMSPTLSDSQVQYVIDILNKWN